MKLHIVFLIININGNCLSICHSDCHYKKMGLHILYLDSRERYSGSPSNPTFILSKPILNVISVEMKSFSFANTLHNIDDDNNKLSINGIDISIPTGYYSPFEIIAKLRDLGLFCELSTNNTITWEVGTNELIFYSSAADVFGLLPGVVYTANFKSILTLASPLAIQISSPSLQLHGGDISSSSSKRNRVPLMIVPVTSGYGVMQTYEHNYKLDLNISTRCLDKLTFNINDARAANRAIDELRMFSFIIFFHTSDV